MPKWIFENIKSNKFPENMNELHYNMKEWVQTSIFNVGLNPIKPKTDMSDVFFDMLKSNISLGLAGPQIEMYWDYYFTSFILGTKFIHMKPPIGYLFPCYISEIWPINTFQSLISTVIDDRSQEDLMNRYIIWLMSQKTIEWWSIMTPAGSIPGPVQTLPLLIKPKRKKRSFNESLSGT